MRKLLFLFCLCFGSVTLFAQEKQESKTIYFLKSELSNVLRNSAGSVMLEKVDTSYVFSIVSFDYLESKCIALSKKKARKNLLSFRAFTSYLKANAKVQKRDDMVYLLDKDKFFILEPLNKKKYKAYPIPYLLYVASHDPMGVLEDF